MLRLSQFVVCARKFWQVMCSSFGDVKTRTAGKTITQRDIYYSLKHLFKIQSECNAMILETGLLLALKRCQELYNQQKVELRIADELGIVSTARGYVAGDLIYKFCEDDPWINCNHTTAAGKCS